jgi:predicted dehydrogenase/threonine dehydrogenase-like Zn-dependent dehydrogenase
MNQLTQKLKSGMMSVHEVPMRLLQSGHVLVKNRYSLISTGTEGSTVATARKGYLGKARERPQQVKQVLDVLKTQGPVQTYRAVMKKLDAYSPLGYSSAGEVIEIRGQRAEDRGKETEDGGRRAEGGGQRTAFRIGDLVACGGLTACHAEVVTVPENLCVKLPPDADLKRASYNTLGAIALQGVRQAGINLGETCAVIGLGLIGQITGILLKVAGVRTIGIDIDQGMVSIAQKNAFDLAFVRQTDGVEQKIARFTTGLGCDGVIITAGSSSLDPINFAGAIARKRGTVVVVGAVPTGFNRDPHYYKKELQVKMSCSYGPGRYDLNYEEKGIDYPPAYVRWTENRNMQAFQDLVYSGKIDIDYLTTHEFSLAEAPKAYDLLVNRTEPFLGILIKYDTSKEIARDRIFLQKSEARGQRSEGGRLNAEGGRRKAEAVSIGFIGAGSYAQSHLLPNIPKDDPVVVKKGVMTSSGTTSKRVAEKFGFEFCTSEEEDLFKDDSINTVFITTRHDSHADYVLKALEAGKHVFVEKPLCLNEEELQEIINVYNSALGTRHSALALMVGYNRRFSPLATMLKEKLGSGPMSMIYRVNAGAIPADTWIQDPDMGGARIIGEVCHFVDFLTFMCGSLPKRVYAAALPDPQNLNDTVTVNLEFENGSIGTISYFSNGASGLTKEYVEVYRDGVTGVLNDFKKVEIFSSGRPKRKKLLNQDKGQKTMVREFIQRIKDGGEPLIPFEEIYAVSMTAFKSLESIRTCQTLPVLE